jgi:phytoene dehydrogenase-like protein
MRDRGDGEYDAVVVGSGPNGLAAAVTLTAAGLRALVVEGSSTVGGGCRTEELTLPGFWHDVCSTAHPLALASPFFGRFDLGARGVRFAEPAVVLAHPLDGGRAAVVTRSVAATAASLGADGNAYRHLIGRLAADWRGLSELVLSSMRRPPTRLSPGLAAFAWNGWRPAALIARQFRTAEGAALIAGLAGHAMMPLTAVPTGATALTLGALAHGTGWPVARGGSATITDAMTSAIVAGGGRIETGRWVRSLAELPEAAAVLLDLAPAGLVSLAGDMLPGRYRSALQRYRYGPGVCKVDFALSGPVPWTNRYCRQAGTLHLGGTYREIADAEAMVAAGQLPRQPYVLVVQPSLADPTRAPAGQQTLWAYCHVPAGSDSDLTAAVVAQVERFAPGFRDVVLDSAVRTAAAQQAHNPNYIGGDIAAGLQTVRQTLARPVARWNPYRTPVRGLYLCSSSTPPLPGVHGRCGELAALTALRDVFGIRRPPALGPVRQSAATEGLTAAGRRRP